MREATRREIGLGADRRKIDRLSDSEYKIGDGACTCKIAKPFLGALAVKKERKCQFEQSGWHFFS